MTPATTQQPTAAEVGDIVRIIVKHAPFMTNKNTTKKIAQALADREAAARADEREHGAKIVDLLADALRQHGAPSKLIHTVFEAAAAIRARKP